MRMVMEGEARWWRRRVYHRARWLLKGHLAPAATRRLRVTVRLETAGAAPGRERVRCAVTVTVAGRAVLRGGATAGAALLALEAALAPLRGWLDPMPAPWAAPPRRAKVAPGNAGEAGGQ